MVDIIRRTLMFVFSLVSLLGVSLTFYLTEGLPGRLPKESRASYELLTSQNWVWDQNSECLERYALPEATDFPWWFCYLEEARPPDIGLLGSSRNNQLVPGFEKNSDLAPFNVLSIGTCGLLMDRQAVIEFGGPNPCDVLPRNIQFDFFEETFRESPLPIVLIDVSASEDPAVNQAALKRLEEVQFFADKVVVVAPWKVPPFSPEDCLLRPIGVRAMSSCTVPLEYWDSEEKDWMVLRSEIEARFPAVLIFDPNIAFCDTRTCHFLSGGKTIMRDGSHISVHGSELVAGVFVDWARDNDLFENGYS